ncbi:MAG TPA: Fur family transcriptional regulator [Candidatus Binatia bacterium]|nr:Fur family transcriptional regulator [Candidatus Binatia bacterium]
MDRGTADLLERHGIQPSAQRVAVADYVLRTAEHPSADLVWARVRSGFPFVSRATVYNTLNLLVERKLLRALVLAEGKVVFDPNVDQHHHFIDETTGRIHDVPWDAVEISRLAPPRGFDVHEYQVVMRGTCGAPKGARPAGTAARRAREVARSK